MKDLIEKLAQAEGPSRELDCLIAAEVDWALEGLTLTPKQGIIAFGLDWLTESANNYQSIFREIPRYTASIDAALTLVPEGWCWTVAVYWCEGEDKPPYYADCGDLEALKNDAGSEVIFEAWAQTPAIALCIAALSAKEPSQ